MLQNKSFFVVLVIVASLLFVAEFSFSALRRKASGMAIDWSIRIPVTIDESEWILRPLAMNESEWRPVVMNESDRVRAVAINESVLDTTRERGYLIALDIPEQTSGAINDILQLYIFSRYHLNLELIEPFVSGSRVLLLPQPQRLRESKFSSLPTLSTYFNNSYMLNNFKKCFDFDRLHFHTFTDFLIHASRKFVFVRFIINSNTARSLKVFEDVSKCNMSTKSAEKQLNFFVEQVKEKAMENFGPSYLFKGIYSVCVKAFPSQPFSLHKVAHFIREWMNTQMPPSSKHFVPHFSVVVLEWHGSDNKRGSYFYYDPSLRESNFSGPCKWDYAPHTAYVLKAAEAMVQESGLSQPFIAVHLRTERVSQPETRYGKRGFMDQCINTFKNLLAKVTKERKILLKNVVYVHDGGEYGSHSMNPQRKKAFDYLVSKIANLGVRNIQYTPKNDTMYIDEGLSQFVEQEFLVSADVLILLGYGGYQHVLTQRFLRKTGGNKNNLYHICTDNSNVYLPGMHHQ